MSKTIYNNYTFFDIESILRKNKNVNHVRIVISLILFVTLNNLNLYFGDGTGLTESQPEFLIFEIFDARKVDDLETKQ